MRPEIRTILAASGIAVGAAGNLLAIVSLPWSAYGAIEMRLDRFPGWRWHVAAVAALYVAAVWALLAPAARRRLPIATSAVAGLAAAGSAIALATRYDDSSLFFDTFVPAIKPLIGTGPVLAVLCVLVCLASVAACWPRSGVRPAPHRPDPAVPQPPSTAPHRPGPPG